MATIINSVISSGGGMFPLVFKDGHIENIPIRKVHFEPSGITTLPENTYPIVAQANSMSMNRDAYGWGGMGASFGVTGDSLSLGGGGYNDNSQQAGTTCNFGRSYLPMCVNTFENLKNGNVSYYNSHGGVPSGWQAIFIYAEK